MVKPVKYVRCPKCKELISPQFADDCPNCRDRDPNYTRRHVGMGKRGAPTLDIQERNSGKWGDDK